MRVQQGENVTAPVAPHLPSPTTGSTKSATRLLTIHEYHPAPKRFLSDISAHTRQQEQATVFDYNRCPSQGKDVHRTMLQHRSWVAIDFSFRPFEFSWFALTADG